MSVKTFKTLLKVVESCPPSWFCAHINHHSEIKEIRAKRDKWGCTLHSFQEIYQTLKSSKISYHHHQTVWEMQETKECNLLSKLVIWSENFITVSTPFCICLTCFSSSSLTLFSSVTFLNSTSISSCLMYLSKLPNVFVQIEKCIWPDCKTYLCIVQIAVGVKIYHL